LSVELAPVASAVIPDNGKGAQPAELSSESSGRNGGEGRTEGKTDQIWSRKEEAPPEAELASVEQSRINRSKATEARVHSGV